ncbi:MAG: hypothetical protein ABIO70_09755 [Pseudomonadota bacterium]
MSSFLYLVLLNPIVTAARDTPSALATSAFVIPPSTMAAHRAHRSGPVSRLAFDTTSLAGLHSPHLRG